MLPQKEEAEQKDRGQAAPSTFAKSRIRKSFSGNFTGLSAK
jgi:hypothetical protein